MPTKDEMVRELIDWHSKMDPEMTRVYRFLARDEDNPREPIKLLEVSTGTLSAGRVMPFAFGPTDAFPYSTVIATVTPDEMDQIERHEISLPDSWSRAERQDYSLQPGKLAQTQNGAK